MAYKGFVGSGTIGHFQSTTALQNLYPADMYAGRMATVEVVAGSATHYYSNGISWQPNAMLVSDSSGKAVGIAGGDGVALGELLQSPTGLTALQAISQAKTRRVDIVMLGDSNQQYGGTGFTAGLDYALSQKFTCYATGIVPGYATNYWGYGVATIDESGLPSSPTLTAGKASTIFAGASGVTLLSGWLATGTSTGIGGATLANNAPVGVNNALKGWFAQWKDTAFSGGTVGPGARLESSPFTTLVAGTAVTTTPDFSRVAIQSISIPANSAGAGQLGFRWSVPGGATPAGPIQTLYTRVENPNAQVGYSTHTLYGSGGQSLWNFAWGIQNTPDQSLTTFFAEVRRLQIAAGYSPIVVIYVNSGLNDRNETNTPSLGPAEVVGTGNSSAEYVDNFRAIKNRIKYIWDLNKWSNGELHWLIVPSHRIADPDDTQLSGYRAAIKSATANDPQTSVVDLGALMTQAQGTANSWYAAGQNFIHLTDAGYQGIGALIVAQTP